MEDEWWEEHCSVIAPEALRFILVGILGTGIATISLVFNTVLFIVLISNAHHRRTHFIYLIFMALIDTFLSASYILLFSVNIITDSYEIEFLATMWWFYLRMMLVVSHGKRRLLESNNLVFSCNHEFRSIALLCNVRKIHYDIKDSSTVPDVL
jgi:hypothetical protein